MLIHTYNHDALAGFVANEHIDWTNASENLVTTGDVTCNTPVITANSSQSYKFINIGGTRLGLQGLSSGSSAGLEMIPNDADGTDTIQHILWLKKDGANQEYFAYRFLGGGNKWEIFTAKNGTGTAMPINIYTPGFPNQLVLNTDGSVLMSNDLTVTGTATIGTLTYTASDPELETFYPISQQRALELLQYSTPPQKWGGASIYFNETSAQLELISHKTNKVYKFVLEEIEQLTADQVQSKAFCKEDHRLDTFSGQIKRTETPQPRYKIKEGYKLHTDTGNITELKKETLEDGGYDWIDTDSQVDPETAITESILG